MTPILAWGFNGGEWLLVLLVILLLFGGKKLPELARALGRSLSEFKKGQDDGAKPEKPTDKIDSGMPPGGPPAA